MPPDSENSGQNLANSVTEISEKVSLLLREEIELAKAEVSEKANSLVKAMVVGAAAGIFIVIGLLFLLHGASWFFYDYVFDHVVWGYVIVALTLFVLGGLAGWLASKWFKSGSPPVPEMAIDEARAIQATLTDKSTGSTGGGV